MSLVLLLALLAGTYEQQVDDAVRLARAGQTTAAREALDQAIAQSPQRPEAWTERGGIAFREKRYADAIPDLQQALRRREDAHTREVLAAALSLAGRTDEALPHWNALGRPLVRRVTVEGLQHTADYVARQEISVRPGEVLKATDLGETREQLEQVGVFRGVDLRAVPLADGRVDLAVKVGEKRGFGNPWELLATSGAHAVRKRFRLQYLNVDGRGVNVGGQYRWDARNEKSLFVEWPRPFGIASYLTVDVEAGRQPFELVDPTTLRRRSAGLMFRAVLEPQSIVRWGVRVQDRSYDRAREGALGGRIVTGEVGLTRRLARTAHVRLDLDGTVAPSVGLDDARPFGRWLAGTRLSWTPRAFESGDGALQPVEVALRGQVGDAWGAVPLDAMFMPGAASEMEFPLRAHKIRRDGVLGRTAFGPTIYALTQEVRVRLYRHPRADLGIVPFLDVVHLPDTAQGGSRTLTDLGVGGRIGVRGSLVLRADYAHGLSDGKDAWSFGIGQSF